MRRTLPLANLWAPVLSAATLLVCYLSASATPLEDARLMDHLIAAYSDYLVGYQGNTLIWKDGTRMPFDDGKSDKNFASLLDAASLKDMFYAPYRVGDAGLSPPVNVDPGHVRYQPFFLKMYGDCRKGETATTITDVVWLPKKWGKPVRVTRVDGVAAARQGFRRVGPVTRELRQIPVPTHWDIQLPGYRRHRTAQCARQRDRDRHRDKVRALLAMG